MTKPTIRHIAIFSRDTEKLAEFYRDVFELEELHRDKGMDHIPAIYLSDGYLTLAVLPCSLRGDSAAGFNHFGFVVDDTEAISERLKGKGLEEARQRPSNRPFAEQRASDPDGNLFDLSEHGFAHVERRADREKRKKVLADA